MTTAAVKIDLERILAGGQLPALPQSAISLLQLSKDPNNGPNEYALPIESDAGLTGQVLKFVNSSYFGFSREISSVRTAITLVGVRTIKNFALWSAVFSLMPNPKCGPFDLKHLWQDSLRRALFGRAVARLLGLREAEDAFAAALLQDMAVPLLAKEYPAEYLKLLQDRTQGERLSELERQTFGWTHAEIGGQMARKWKLPEETAYLIERHTAIDEIVSQEKPNPAQAAVALSALLPTAGDQHWPECGSFQKYYEGLRLKGIQEAAELLAEVDKEFADFAPVLKIASPARTLLQCYNEAQAAGLATGSRTALAT